MRWSQTVLFVLQIDHYVSLTGHRILNLVKYNRTIGYSFRQLLNQMSEPVTENNRMEVEAPSLKRPLEDGDEANRPENPKKPRMKKKKVSMLMSYCGQGYFGMQINHGFKTIEGDLFLAFQKLGIMDEESFKYAQMIGFQRAARTDKGVSATRQVVSLRMCMFIFTCYKCITLHQF